MPFFLRKALSWFSRVILMQVLILIGLKIGFLGRYAEFVRELEPSLLWEALKLGFQFDLFVLQWLWGPLFLGAFLLFALPRLWGKLWLSVLGGWVFLPILLTMIDLEFYGAYQTRLNYNVIEFSKDLQPTLLLLYDSFHLLPYALLFLGIIIAGGGWLWWSYCAVHESSQPTRGWHRLVMMLLLIWFAEGWAHQQVLANRKDARKLSTHTFARALATNPLANLMIDLTSFQELYGSLGDPSYLKTHHDALQSLLKTPGERFLPGSVPTFRLPQQFHQPVKPVKPPYNIVVIYLESMMGERVGALGAKGEYDWSPHFNRLAGQGWLFTRIFSNAPRTGHALESTENSFPTLPLKNRLSAYDKADQLLSLPRLLKWQGYKTLYFRSWKETVRYVRHFDEFYEPDRFERFDSYADKFQFEIVSDETLFQNTLRILKEQPQPFYAVIQTQSSHPPYSCPCQGYDEGFKFMDQALGKFFEALRHEPYFEKTLFVMFGDHGGPLYPENEYQLERYHVPLLFYAPAILGEAPRRFEMLGGQVDILPSLLYLAQLPVAHAAWGRNLLALPPGDLGFASFSGTPEGPEAGWVIPDYFILRHGQEAPIFYRYQWHPLRVQRLKPGELPPELQQEQQRFELYLKSAFNAFLYDQMGFRDASAYQEHLD